jgi:hypothetical protein
MAGMHSSPCVQTFVCKLPTRSQSSEPLKQLPSHGVPQTSVMALVQLRGFGGHRPLRQLMVGYARSGVPAEPAKAGLRTDSDGARRLGVRHMCLQESKDTYYNTTADTLVTIQLLLIMTLISHCLLRADILILCVVIPNELCLELCV